MVKLLQLAPPFVVAVVVERTAAAAARSTAAAFAAGADAAELNLASLPPTLPSGFFRRWKRPVYTSCRRAPFMSVYGAAFRRAASLSDEARMQRQVDWLGQGSAGLDIEADTFAPAPDEWTSLRSAEREQEAVAAGARRAGAAVIFSWHPPRKLRYAEARRAVLALRARGADFVKIVERVRSREEALDSVAISLRLRDELGGRMVFLALGAEALRFRPLMTALGASYLLARPSIGANRLPAQPLVARARAIVDFA